MFNSIYNFINFTAKLIIIYINNCFILLLNFANSIYYSLRLLLIISFFKEFDVISVTDSSGTLKILLSFAVGGLLGDIFLHLLPEAWKTGSLNKGNENTKRESENR